MHQNEHSPPECLWCYSGVIGLVRKTNCLPLSVLTAFNVHNSYSVSMLARLYRLSGDHESSMHALLLNKADA